MHLVHVIWYVNYRHLGSAGKLAARLAQEAQTAAQTPRIGAAAWASGPSGRGDTGPATPHALRFGPSGAPTPMAYDRHGAAIGGNQGGGGGGGGGGRLDGADIGGGAAGATVDGSGGNLLESIYGRFGTTSTDRAVNFVSDSARVVPPAPLSEGSINEHAILVAALNDSRRRAGEGRGERWQAAASAEQLVDGIRGILSTGVTTYCTTAAAAAGGGGGTSSMSAASIAAAQAVDQGYITALDVASSLLLMTPKKAVGGFGAGRTTSHCRSQVLGSLHHLAEQYRSHILATVSRSVMAGSSSPLGGGGGDGFAANVAAFVDLELGRVTPTGATSGAAVSPWRRMYHCLRCGDLVAALATLDQMPASGYDLDSAADLATVATAVKCLSAFQGVKRSIWLAAAETSGASGGGIEILLSSVPSDIVTSAIELYRAATVTATGCNVDDSGYRTVCLSLLCLGSTPRMNDGSDAADGNGANFAASTVEDYLYEGCWGAFFQQNTETAISVVGETVRHFGPSHFEDDGETGEGRPLGTASRTAPGIANHPPLSGGWAFAIPLMACQQFESALTYVAKVGGPAGLLQATHLALVLHLGGVGVVDLRSPPLLVSSDSSILLTSLLSSYASTLTKAAPALEYLVLIPDSGPNGACMSFAGTISRTAKVYVQSLIVKSGAFDDLAGVVSPDGSRISPTGGQALLDVHFSGSEVSDLLCAASDEALRRGNGRDAAELLSLAGRYVELLSLLNTELASLLVIEDPDQEMLEKRVFWRTAGDNFHSIHLTGGRNHVLANLEARNRVDLTSTFALIMNLMVFFDRCQDRDWGGAWSLIDELGLFPSEEDGVSQKVASYQALDSALKGKPFRHAVACTMESLFQQHSALKSRLGSSQTSHEAGSIHQRLGDLRKRARLLVTFAGLCRLDGGVSAKIARMEAYMV